MPYNSETETFYQAPATVVDSTPDGDTVQEGFDDRLTPAMAGLYADLNLLKADGMISVGIPATTTSRGIGRVATAADAAVGSTITNGPAFLDAATWKLSATPAAGILPLADANGRIHVGFIPGIFVGDIRLLPFRPDDLAAHCPGWHFCNGDRYALTSPVGTALNALPANFKADWRIAVSGANISIPNMFHSDGRGYFLRAVSGTTRQVGSIELDEFKQHNHVQYGADDYHRASSGSLYVQKHGTVASQDTGGNETRPINVGMTPAIFLDV